MLVYETADPAIGEPSFTEYRRRYPTFDARRDLAMSLAWPVKNAVMPNVGRRDFNVMAAFWQDKPDQLQKLVAAMVGLKSLVKAYIGESVAIFTEGAPESVDAEKHRVSSEVALLVGKIAGTNQDDDTTNRLYYRFGAREVANEADKLSARPSLSLTAGVNVTDSAVLVSANTATLARVAPHEFDPGEPPSFGVVQGSVTFDERSYPRHRRLREDPILVGNRVVNAFLSDLAACDPSGITGQMWDAMAPKEDAPLPDLRQIFS